MPSGRGNPFPASGPFAPAGRGKRAEKAACNFADAGADDASNMVQNGVHLILLSNCQELHDFLWGRWKDWDDGENESEEAVKHGSVFR